MTRKKLMAGAATVALVFGSAIGSSADAQTVFDGFYGGASVGYYHFHAHNFEDEFVACCSTGTNSGGSHSGDGVNVGLFGGYGRTFDRWYVGGEANGSFNVHADTGEFALINTHFCGPAEGLARVKSQDTFGVGLRFGYLFTPTILGFVKAGPQFTDFRVQYRNLICDAPNADKSKLVVGGQVGAGADIQIGTWDWMSAPIFLRAEYDHTFYPGTGFSQHIGGGEGEGHTFHTRLSDDVAKIGLVIKFGGAAPPPPPVAAAPPPPPPALAPPPPQRQFVVYFNFDKSDLTPEGAKVVSDAAAAYKQTGSAKIAVTGYTDLSGTQKYNLGLSKRRADTVRAELVHDGVPDGVIAEAWRGKENPAVPTPDGVREPRNRRVEIVE
jgi:outer membrane protein OmpA-like peptidoglycan-associated protein